MEFGAISRIWRVTRRICDENPVIGITAVRMFAQYIYIYCIYL